MACATIVKWTAMIFLAAVTLQSILPTVALDLPISDGFHSTVPDDSVSNGFDLPLPDSYLSCRNPDKAAAAGCRALEQDILDSTVRLVLYTKIMHIEGFGLGILGGNGHATVMDGRYLVTHNHYDETIMSLLRQSDPDDLVTIGLYDVNGKTILRVTGQAVLALIVDNEAVVLDFGEKDGIGLFDSLGLRSAEFVAKPPIPLRSGMEVAQVDLEGSKSRVNWVSIEAIIQESETTLVQTSGCINPGASGGGLFWQGYHIGNSWSTSTDCIDGLSDDGIHYSIAALNSRSVTTPGPQSTGDSPHGGDWVARLMMCLAQTT